MTCCASMWSNVIPSSSARILDLYKAIVWSLIAWDNLYTKLRPVSPNCIYIHVHGPVWRGDVRRCLDVCVLRCDVLTCVSCQLTALFPTPRLHSHSRAERRGICSGGMQILIVPRVCCDTVLLLLVIGSPCCRVGAAFTPHVAAVAVPPHIPLAFPVALSRTIEGVAGISP